MRGQETRWGAGRRRPRVPHGAVFCAACAPAPHLSLEPVLFRVILGQLLHGLGLPAIFRPALESGWGGNKRSDASPGIEGFLVGAPFWKGLQGTEPACFLINSEWGFLTLPAEFVQRQIEGGMFWKVWVQTVSLASLTS